MLKVTFDPHAITVTRPLVISAISLAGSRATKYGEGRRKNSATEVIAVNTMRGSDTHQKYMWHSLDSTLELNMHRISLAAITLECDKNNVITRMSMIPLCEFMEESEWLKLFQQPFAEFASLGANAGYLAAKQPNVMVERAEVASHKFTDADPNNWAWKLISMG